MTGLNEVMEKPPRLLSSQLFHKQGLVEVVLNRSVLAWKETETSGKRGINNISEAGGHAVQVCEIVAVRETEDVQTNTEGKRRNAQQQLYPCAFTVSFVRRTGQHRWRCSDITFRCTNQGLCQQWIQTINEQLSLLSSRPKSLLVYINPYGGRRLGKRIYEQKVAPLFRRASISADVIVTERANHARDHLKAEANLGKYDGVVCVGGDGMFSEILHGLVTRIQNDHGVDQNQPEADLVRCSLRIGIIPAGDSQPMDVCSVHHNNTFLRYSVSMLGYGFYGDVLTDSERKRWMGPARYDLSGVKTFLSHNYYEGTVSFLPAEDHKGNPRDKLQCRTGCRVCQHKHQSEEKPCEMPVKENSDIDSGAAWPVIRGKFIAVNAASMSCACPRSPKGLSPSAHLADGTADLILIRKCSRLDFFRHLLRHTNKDDQFDHAFVEVHRVRGFRFQPKRREAVFSVEDPSETGKRKTFGPFCSGPPACDYTSAHSSWNCDGEILSHAAIQVSVQCQLIRLFARGIEEQQCVSEEPYTL
ncbi:ceramide kinase isoform 2-T2 [Polymixia lowei]